jgi:dynein heavy chain 1
MHSSVQLIKRGAIIESDKKFHNQIRVISLADSSPYETLHSYVSNTVAPYFKSYIKRGSGVDGNKHGKMGGAGAANDSSLGGGGGRLMPPGVDLNSSNSGMSGTSSATNGETMSNSDQFVSNIEKKIAEVELGLLNLQQNIDIPEINLIVHPAVTAMIKKCSEENRKPKADEFADRIEDADFLNQLQKGVSRWVSEIKKVTKLDRDPSTGTALQEISFWLGLERALNRISEKRESVEITLTLDILRYGKRFIATVSFDSDTGLKEAVETAKDYNVLMKDFPLNELISATELAKITVAIQNIFNHLKKIRNTKYPLNRLLKLIEAISKDLTTQLLKVLSTQRLMLVPFDDYERTMKVRPNKIYLELKQN